ncbi:hypothetical protein ILUMI_20030 [Ignelater luminosus]|uniref:Sm domain-containing protein n=1 Tax=Ignelater luminosus TaxID=2038154 RepID=A0A8K0CKH9_IGNLU|nr:hypothetical protein ILUMI_20030 [Ignelater luminosus]
MVEYFRDGRVTIELKNGLVVQGTVTDVERTMNVYLKEVRVIFRDHKQTYFPVITVRGNNIAYIVPPDTFNAEAALKKFKPEKPDQKTKASPGRGIRGRIQRAIRGKRGGKVHQYHVQPDASGQASTSYDPGYANRSQGNPYANQRGNMSGRGGYTGQRGSMSGRGRGRGIRGRGGDYAGQRGGMNFGRGGGRGG